MTGITPLPTPPSTSDPTNFNTRADAFLGALPAFVTEANAYGAYLAAAALPAAAYIAGLWASGTSGDPGAGGVGGNNATQSLSTALRIDDVDALGAIVSAIVDTFDDSTSLLKGFVRVQKVGDPSKWALWRVNGAVVNSTGYRTVPVQLVAGSASSPFTAGDAVVTTFTAVGDKGDAGTGQWSSDGSTVTVSGTPTSITIPFSSGFGNMSIKCASLALSTNADLSLSGSTDGTNFTGGVAVTNTAATGYAGTILLTDYRDTQVMVGSTLDGTNFRGGNLTGPLVAVRLTPNSGTFSSGTIRPRGS